jgi:methylenetetrahydrofolate dehydrogenase (NADP+)/methenyltetrahydrofolate cyclohydrolase
MEMLKFAGQNLTEKNILVMGYGQLVGRPVSYLLEKMGCRVTVARSKTENVEELLKSADVVVSAVGKPKLITGDKIKSGAIVIDAGTAESEGGIVGDVDFESVKNFASFISPVPGGVGPVTVAMLLLNVLKVAKIKLLAE